MKLPEVGIMDTEQIYQELIDLEMFLAKPNIEALKTALQSSVESGKVSMRGDRYMAVQVMTEVMGVNKSRLKVLRHKYPKISDYVQSSNQSHPGAGGGSSPGMVTFFGIFYLGAILNYTGKRRKGKHSPTLYIYRDPGNKALKVGVTVDLNGRKKNAVSANPFLILIATFEVDTEEVERELHRILYDRTIAHTVGWYFDTIEIRERINRFLLDRLIVDSTEPNFNYLPQN